jgi:hypothetical protein
MHTSVAKLFALGLLVSGPIASAYAIPSTGSDLAKKDESSMAWIRSLLPLDARHHTASQIAAKKAGKAGRGVEARHHTASQIAVSVSHSHREFRY